MKKTAKILALLLLAVTTMVSCTKNNSTNNGNQNANLIVGKWKCVSYSNGVGENIGEIGGYDWSKVGDLWNFSDDGTLDFKVHTHQNTSPITIPVSSHYIISEKWLTVFCYQISGANGTVSFEITEISKDKLTLDAQTLFLHYHIGFEKVE